MGAEQATIAKEVSSAKKDSSHFFSTIEEFVTEAVRNNDWGTIKDLIDEKRISSNMRLKESPCTLTPPKEHEDTTTSCLNPISAKAILSWRLEEPTILHYAISVNNLSIVDLLIKKGADVNNTCRLLRVKDYGEFERKSTVDGSMRPIDVAALKQNREIFKILFKANPRCQNPLRYNTDHSNPTWYQINKIAKIALLDEYIRVRKEQRKYKGFSTIFCKSINLFAVPEDKEIAAAEALRDFYGNEENFKNKDELLAEHGKALRQGELAKIFRV